MPWQTIIEYYSTEDGTELNKSQIKNKEYVKNKKSIQKEWNKYTGWGTTTIRYECEPNRQTKLEL